MGIESILGKSLSELTVEDIPVICKNEEFLKLMADREKAIEIADEIIDTNKDKDVVLEFIPIKLSSEIYLAKVHVSKLFKKFDEDNDRDSLINELKESLLHGQVHKKLVTAVAAMGAVSDFDISEFEDILKISISNIENILYEKVNLEKALPLACDILDLIFTIRENYYNLYKIDLIEDKSNLENYVEQLNQFMKPMYDAMQEEAERLANGKKPEELGLLDITKLQKD